MGNHDDLSPSFVHADKPRPCGAAIRSGLARSSSWLQRDRRQQILDLNALKRAVHITTLRGASKMWWRKLVSPFTASTTTSNANQPEPPTAASQCKQICRHVQV